MADIINLRQDPAFAAVRDSPPVQRLAAEAVANVVPPPPIGSGGIG